MQRRKTRSQGQKRRKASPRRRVTVSPCPPAPASPEPAVDPLRRAELDRHVELLTRIRQHRTLTGGQRREFAELEAKYSGKGPQAVPAGLAVLVSTEEQLAEVYGYDVRTVQRLKHEPDWPAGQRGPYALAAVGPWVRARREAEARPAEGSSAEQARARRVNVMADIAEIELRRRRGEVLDRADVMATWREQCAVFKTAAESIGQQHPEITAELNRVIAQLDRDLRLRYPEPKGGQT